MRGPVQRDITPGARAGTAPAHDPAAAADLERVERLARLMDARYGIPGTRFRFGLDSLLGLVPGVGDTLALAPSAWMVWRAWHHGVPRNKLAKMAVNTGVDYVVGSIPVVGDLFDFGFKANLRNAAILREHLQQRGGAGVAGASSVPQI